MKKLLQLLFVLFTLVLLSTVSAMAQGFLEDPKEVPTLVNFLGWFEALYGALVIVLGYLTAYIPGINKIPSVAWRLVAVGMIIGGIFLALGANGFGLVLQFLLSGKFYDLVLIHLGKTPKVVAGNP